MSFQVSVVLLQLWHAEGIGVCVWISHQLLRGRSATHKKSWTAVAQPYPKGVCEELASNYVKGAALRRWILLVDVPPTLLLQEKAELEKPPTQAPEGLQWEGQVILMM